MTSHARSLPAVLLVAVLVASVPPARAAGRDAPGCPEAPVVGRLPGCVIRECKVRDYDEAELQAGPVAPAGDFPRALVDGPLSIVTYACPRALTLDHIARQAQATVRREGYTFVYSGHMLYNDLPGFTARKGSTWVQVVSEPLDRQPGYTVTVVKADEASLPAGSAPPPSPNPRPQR